LQRQHPAVIGPDGQIRQRTGPLFTPATLVAEVPLRTTVTLATRLAALPEYAIAGIALLALGWTLWAGKLARRRTARSASRQAVADPEEMVSA